MNQKIIRPDFSRRDFLKTTSTLAAAAALAPGVFAANDDTLKLALMGCGGRGSGAASQALSTSGQVKLVAMADVFKDRLDDSYNALKAQHADRVDVSEDNKFVGFDAYKSAIAQADVVILATPPGFRPPLLEEAVRQGKNIFTEKPLAVDGPGVRKVLAAAKEAKKKNLKVGVGLQRRHQAGYIETLKRLHDGAIGEIIAMRCYWNGNTPWVRARKEFEQKAGRPLTEMEYQMRNWYYFVWLCGDHIVEQHIHNLDVINWVKNGHPVRCWGMGGRQCRQAIDNGEIFDHHAVEYEYADGSRLASQCRQIAGCWDAVSEAVVGTKGSCDVSGHQIYAGSQAIFVGKGEVALQLARKRPLPTGARRPFRGHPQRHSLQRTGTRRLQHVERGHGPHGDLFRQGNQLGRRAQFTNRHHAQSIVLGRQPADLAGRGRPLQDRHTGRDRGLLSRVRFPTGQKQRNERHCIYA